MGLCDYVLSALFLACGILSVAACHQKISEELSGGIPFTGNELVIMNLYLQSAVPYLAYAALLFLGGRLCRLRAPSEHEQADWAQKKASALPSDQEAYYQINGERRDEEMNPGSWSSR